jgi:hypothetical protein
MVLRTALLLGLLAGQAGAGCLPAGKTPGRVMFEDGQVNEGIRRQGDRLGYDTYTTAGEKVRVETRWAMYPPGATPNGPATVFDWQGARLIAPSDLVKGQETVVQGTLRSGGTARPFRMALRLVGPDSVEVAGCRYAVLRISVQGGPVDGPRSDGEIWLDADRMVVWASEMRVQGKGGKVEREQSARDLAAD